MVTDGSEEESDKEEEEKMEKENEREGEEEEAVAIVVKNWHCLLLTCLSVTVEAWRVTSRALRRKYNVKNLYKNCDLTKKIYFITSQRLVVNYTVNHGDNFFLFNFPELIIMLCA